jgi:peptidoglycan/xylan/chitin deacetylase (PgdA/CDA1 family)
LKVKYAGAISTGLVLIFGFAIVLPGVIYKSSKDVYAPPDQSQYKKVMLAFSVHDMLNLPNWCNDLSSFLKTNHIKATIFVTGYVADKYPNCVTSFSYNSDIDIGSQTYSYVDLVSGINYPDALLDVQKGKNTIDEIGNMSSKLFRSPYGSVDQNIYSLLNRSGIIADFSYKDHYNKYERGMFVKYNLNEYEPNTISFKQLPKIDVPYIVNFNNTVPLEKITSLISKLKLDKDINFVTASELAGLKLTVR